MAYNKVSVLAWNRQGVHYRFESIRSAARELDVSISTINARMKDHYPIVKPGQRGIYVARG